MAARALILQTALDLFGRHGYHGVSTRDIARAVEISPSAMYHHFRSKEELLFEILSKGLDDLCRTLDDSLEMLAEEPPRSKLSELVRQLLSHAVEHQFLWMLARSELRSLGPEGRREIVAKRDYIEHRIREVVREGAAAGSWTVGRHTNLAVFNLFAMADGQSRWYKSEGPTPLVEVLEFQASFFLRGLGLVLDSDRQGRL